MKELLLQLSFKQFLKTPFSWIFMGVICLLIWLGKALIADKDGEISDYKEMVDECDDERKRDKQLLQEIVFQQKLNTEIHGQQDTIH